MPSKDGEIILDNNSYPAVADLEAAATVKDPDTRSGNPHHDISTGRFGEGGNVPKDGPNIPAGQDPIQYLRQLDAVRDAARELDNLTPEDIAAYLEGRTKRPLEAAEMQAFLQQVRQQRITDLVDVMDGKLRGLLSGRKAVRLTASGSWIKKTVNGLSEEELIGVVNRLEARGHTRESLNKGVLGKVTNNDTKASTEAKLADIPEDWEGVELSLFSENDVDFKFEGEDIGAQLSEVLKHIAENQKPQEINIHVDARPGKTITKKVIRNPKTNLIESVVETEVDAES